MPKLHARAAVTGALAVTLALAGSAPAWSATLHTPAPSRASAAASYNRTLYGVTTVSSRSAWAVGVTNRVGIGAMHTLVMHWNGTSWTHVKSPDPNKNLNYLYAVSADSAKDAWAVGFKCTCDSGGNFGDTSLIEHWNGAAWSVSPAPKIGKTDLLNGVEALSRTDVWAVGRACVSGCTAKGTTVPVWDSLILHWDGTAWSQVPSPDPGATANTLDSVSADSATDVWAVGDYGSGPVYNGGTFVLHWNGTTWSQVASPNPTGADYELESVSAISPTDAWAVGNYCSQNCDGDGLTQRYSALAMNWNGSAWSVVPTPLPATTRVIGLSAVSGVSAKDVWAVGGTHTLSWDGTAWSTVTNPDSSNASVSLSAVAAGSSTDVWAVGDNFKSEPYKAIDLNWNGTAWSLK